MKSLNSYLSESILSDWKEQDLETPAIEEWIKNDNNMFFDADCDIINGVVNFSSKHGYGDIHLLEMPPEYVKFSYDDDCQLSVHWQGDEFIKNYNKNIAILNALEIKNTTLEYKTRHDMTLNLAERFKGFYKTTINIDKACKQLMIDLRYTRIGDFKDLDFVINKYQKSSVQIDLGSTRLGSTISLCYEQFGSASSEIIKQMKKFHDQTKIDTIFIRSMKLTWDNLSKSYRVAL